jgi:integrase
MQEGWVTDNIPEKTRSNSVEVVRSRLTLDDFNRIHAVALTFKNKWLARAMELALVTAQRREDIAQVEFRQYKDSTSWIENDALCVIQQKTKNQIRIPLNIGVNGITIASVTKSCRDNILSRWLIHHSQNANNAKPGDPVWIDTISRRFAEARDMAGIKGEEGKMPPSFHEIRSLSIRLYAAQFGGDFAQTIAGHKDASMTAVYRDVRGAEWVQVHAKID